MYSNEQIELRKKFLREMDEIAYKIWLQQYEEPKYYSKQEEDRYDAE